MGFSCGWEYITTLDYEWDFIRGRRPYRWTIWIYSLTRTATLITVILVLINLNLTTPIDCQVLTTFELVTSYTGFLAASLLIVFRIAAIWNKKKFIVGIGTAVWLTNVGVTIWGITRIRSAWSPLLQVCIVFNTEDNMPNIVVTFISDVILLIVVLVGLRREGGGVAFPLGRLLWNQGVIWLAIATAAEALPMASWHFFCNVFIILNLSDTWNIIFQSPSLVIMTIAATRMHRSLSDFAFGSKDALHSSNVRSLRGLTRATSTRSTFAPSQLNRIEVAVNVAYEEHKMSETKKCTDEEPDDKSHTSKFGHGSDLESSVENRV
ncbi:hypothetical protein BJV77DRAFT_1160891 [Russula vinacea]|nr:hypothetical protein BJV77DRAFT_1160891 [Russula vinacea]